MKDITKLIIIIVVFLFFYFLPLGNNRVNNAILEAFYLTQDYARHHVILCLVPAFFIAGAMSVFLKKEAVLKFLGPKANKIIAYSIASISGTILAVCSCTVLPIFAGIYKRGAGIGPAFAFLYSGPAINVLAITLTARILGLEMGLARFIGAVLFSLLIGIIIQSIFKEKNIQNNFNIEYDKSESFRSNWITFLYFFMMIAILVFANWAKDDRVSFWNLIYSIKWYLVLCSFIILIIIIKKWFSKNELKEWVRETWTFTWQIMPLLFAGVLVAGFLLGRPQHTALIPEKYIINSVGGNSIRANFFASIAGAFMYFATLTEIPILQGLIGSGMGKGPALALLLAGPAVSLPNMLVLHSILGTKKTIVYILLVIIMATISGIIYGYMQ